jgi:hypothetical protein
MRLLFLRLSKATVQPLLILTSMIWLLGCEDAAQGAPQRRAKATHVASQVTCPVLRDIRAQQVVMILLDRSYSVQHASSDHMLHIRADLIDLVHSLPPGTLVQLGASM